VSENFTEILVTACRVGTYKQLETRWAFSVVTNNMPRYLHDSGYTAPIFG